MARRRRTTRTFKRADYAAMLEQTIRLGDYLPPEHLARFVVDAVAQLDVSRIYGHYGTRGGEPYAPEVLLGLLFYGYATGVFSTRKIERATYAEAKAVLQARAAERDAQERAAYDAKMQERAEKEARTGRHLGGRAPTPPTPGPRDSDQYNFTDPTSRIMKNPTNRAMEQHYNGQVAVEQESVLIVGHALSNHPNDQHEAEPTLDAIPAQVGTPEAAALDTGYFSAATIAACETRGIEPYIATGRTAHHQGWRASCAPLPPPSPPDDASPKEQMAYKLKTALGQAIYRRRTCTVEPVLGCLKEVLGFRQFSLRGLDAAAGEWCLLCVAWNLKRLHVLSLTQGRPLPASTAPGMVGPAVLGFLVLILWWSALIGSAATAQRRLRRIIRTVQVAGWPLHSPLRTFSPTNC